MCSVCAPCYLIDNSYDMQHDVIMSSLRFQCGLEADIKCAVSFFPSWCVWKHPSLPHNHMTLGREAITLPRELLFLERFLGRNSRERGKPFEELARIASCPAVRGKRRVLTARPPASPHERGGLARERDDISRVCKKKNETMWQRCHVVFHTST